MLIWIKKPIKARILCEIFLSEHSWNTISGHFMKHERLSWNTFALVSKFHCVCYHQWINCVYREKMSPDSENLIALNFDDTCYS